MSVKLSVVSGLYPARSIPVLDVATVDDVDLLLIHQLSNARANGIGRSFAQLHVGTDLRREVDDEQFPDA